MSRTRNRVAFIALVTYLSYTTAQLNAQSRLVTTPDGKTIAVQQSPAGARPSAAARPQASRPANQAGKQPGKADAADNKPADKPGSKKKDDSKEPAGPKVTKRPEKPPQPADPEELKVRPDENGELQFNFKGQPWPAVLEWLAEVSNVNLDWQELPGDYLNLVTQKRYSIEQTRDLINSRLLSRGFTILRDGEIMSVVKTSGIDPSLVPRIAPEDLTSRSAHEFVRVSFELDWLLADKLVAELEPMVSPNGKLTKLTATNRLEAMDAVKNLREIHRLLQEEQSLASRQQRVREFQLDYTKSEEVVDHLKTLLGLEKSGPATPLTPQQIQQMQQQAARNSNNKQAPAPPKVEVFLVANVRKNSVIAHAPPDKMAVIAEAILILDVAKSSGKSFLENVDRTKVYRLASIEPEPIVQTLTDLGNLDPTTTLQIDKSNGAIIAHASLADHLIIGELVKKLDGSARQFRVIPLRRLRADYVAGTIEFMMGAGEKDNQQMSSSYYIYNRYSSQSQQTQSKSDKFRVDADVENNRLLLRCNEIEYEEIENLLIKMGEMPSPDGNPDRIRMIDVEPGQETDRTLELILREWNSLRENELIIQPSARPPVSEELEEENEDKPQPTDLRGIDTRTEIKPLRGNVGSAQVLSSHELEFSEKTTPRNVARGYDRSSSRFDREIPLKRVSNSDERAARERIIDQRDDRQSSQRLIAQNESYNENPTARRWEDFRSGRSDDYDGPNSAEQRRTSPPISISRGPDGRLILKSDDTEALDMLEELLIRHAPPRRDYAVFKLKYPNSYAYGIALTLEDFFKAEDEDGGGTRYDPFYGRYYSGGNSKDTNYRLSNRRPLKFISDSDTGTILVTGADPRQLKTIAELIDLYDQPEPTDARLIRQTRIFPIKYSKARIIAEAIKDVYRDLLSENDKALSDGNKKEDQKPTDRSYTYIYGYNEGEEEPEDPIKFKGLLSLGIDELSNTLVVSAQGTLLDNVATMIDELDKAAMPTSTVQVYQASNNVNTSLLREKLSTVLSETRKAAQQQKEQPQGGQQQGENAANANGGNGNATIRLQVQGGN